MTDDEGYPLILRARQNVRPITLRGDDLHGFYSGQSHNEEQCHDQEYASDDTCCSLSSEAMLDRATYAGRRRSYQK